LASLFILPIRLETSKDSWELGVIGLLSP